MRKGQEDNKSGCPFDRMPFLYWEVIDLRAENAEGVLTIFLAGEIDAQNAATVQREMDAFLERRGNAAVVFDAKDLSYISSAGLRVLLAAQKEVGNRISVAHLRPEVLEIFKMAGIQMLMDIKGS